VNDHEDDLRSLARFVAQVPGVRQIEVLPYHRIGVQKYNRLGQPYRMPNARPPTDDHLDRAVQAFADLGLATRVVGRSRNSEH
jgi:pyruvate formate lyase activating enzyme